jgi:hypothetical protein
MLLFVVMTCYSHNILSQTSGIILYQAKVDNNCILPLMHKIILPSSVEVMLHEKPISRKDFTIDELKIKLLTCDASDTTNYIIRYRFLVLPKVTTYTLIDTSKMTIVDPLNKVVKFNPDKGKPDKVITSENLNYNGSFSRGFAVGNTQNLVLNSNFDMVNSATVSKS